MLNIAIAVFPLLLLISTFDQSEATSKSKPKYIPTEVKILKDKPIFTADSLAEFDGIKNKKIYLAIKGVVFDVSEGKQFYGPGTAYETMAGRDVSQAVARWSLKKSHMNGDLSSLNDDQLRALDNTFSETYDKKYYIVGYMDYMVSKSPTPVKEEF